MSATEGCVPWAWHAPRQLPLRQGSFRPSHQTPVSTLGSTSCQSHLGHDRQCLLWPEPSGTMEQRPTSASAEPPWEDVASEILLLPLYGIALGSTLWDAAEPSARLGQNLLCTFSVTLCVPGGCPAASSARCRLDLRQGLSDTSRGPGAVRVLARPALEARPGAARKAGHLSPESPAGSSLSAPLARPRGAALGCAALRSSPDRAGPLDAASPLLLPAGPAPAVGECGAAGAAGWRARRGGAAGSGRGGGRAAGPAGSRSPRVPWKQRPGLPAPALVPAAPAELGAREWGRSGGAGRTSSGPLPAGGGEAGQGGFQFGGLGGSGEPCGPELPGGGCSLGGRGVPEPGPGPRDGPTLRGSGRRRGRRAPRPAEPFIPPRGLHPFTARPTAGCSRRSSCQTAGQTMETPLPQPPPLGRVSGELGDEGVRAVPGDWLLTSPFPAKGWGACGQVGQPAPGLRERLP